MGQPIVCFNPSPELACERISTNVEGSDERNDSFTYIVHGSGAVLGNPSMFCVCCRRDDWTVPATLATIASNISRYDRRASEFAT